MRTIRLREHEPHIVDLSDQELRDLLALPSRLIEVVGRPDGRYRIKAGSRVGTIVLSSLRILIRPKVGLRNVFFLLGYSVNTQWDDGDFPYDEDDLFRAVAWWFDREVGRAARFGIARAYMDREETLTTIRGRVAIDRQIAVRPGRRFPIECRFQEYSDDTDLNRLLKAAHDALLRLPQLDRDVAIRLRHRSRHLFGGVDISDYSFAGAGRVDFNRLNRVWEPAGRLAELILQQRSIRDDEGKVVGRTFTVDMNRLFERFLERVLQERLETTSYALEPQARRRLTFPGTSPGGVAVPAVNMRPDFLITHAKKPVAVADAKYKELLRVGDWEHPDIYQLIAYCVRLGLSSGVLIYAGPRPATESRVLGSILTIRTVGVDLTGSPYAILQEARKAADLVIAVGAAESPAAA